MSNNGRPIIRILIQNFLNSFRPRQIKGDFKGEDYFGNKFYEIKADPSRGKRKTSRWYEPPGKPELDYGHEVTAEWESWLRGRRQDPPTKEELLKNLAIMDMKKKNAAVLEGKFEKPQDHASIKHDTATGRATFPRYDEEYEIMPGSKPIKQKD